MLSKFLKKNSKKLENPEKFPKSAHFPMWAPCGKSEASESKDSSVYSLRSPLRGARGWRAGASVETEVSLDKTRHCYWILPLHIFKKNRILNKSCTKKTKFGYFGGLFSDFTPFRVEFRRFICTIWCVSSSYEFWYPICPPSSKDLGVLTKKLQIWLFWGHFGDFARFGG